MYSIKKVFLVISQNSQEHLCQSLFFNTVAGLGQVTLAQVFSSSILQHF